jgi:hypothetical protein
VAKPDLFPEIGLFLKKSVGLAILHIMLRLVESTCSWLARYLIGQGGLLSAISQLFVVPVLVLWAGLEKGK